MRLSGVVSSLFDVVVKYACEVLLEGDDKGQDPIIFKRSLKVAGFMNKDLIEVRIVVLDFILKIASVYMS